MWELRETDMQDGEKIDYVDTPSTWRYLRALAVSVFLSIFISIVLLMSDYDRVPLMIRLLLYLLAVSPGVHALLVQRSTQYIITNRSLIFRSGILTNNIKSMPFDHVTSVEVRETLMGRLCGYADLLLDTSGSGVNIETRWDYVKSAHDVRRRIGEHLQALRKSRSAADVVCAGCGQHNIASLDYCEGCGARL